MKKSETKPIFSMSYSSLMQLGDKSIMLIERDAAELAVYAVNDAVKTNIAEKTQALKDLPTDEELLAAVSLNTEEKNKCAEDTRTAIRSITVRAKNLWGENSAKYKQFGVKGLDKMTDEDLFRCAKRVIRTASDYLSELSAKGLSQEEITQLNDVLLTFDDKIDTKNEAVRERDIAAEQRAELGNELYKLITEVFDYGKDYFYSRDEAKYNDYIIYDHAGGGKKPEIKIPAGSRASLFEDPIDEEAVFEIENTGPVPLILFTANNADADIPDNAETLEMNQSQIIKSKDISNGTFGLLIAVNETETEGKLLVSEIKE